MQHGQSRREERAIVQDLDVRYITGGRHEKGEKLEGEREQHERKTKARQARKVENNK